MSLLNVFEISGSAMTAQSHRLNAVASNLANADSVTGPSGQAYRAKQVVFGESPLGGATGSGVKVINVVEDGTPGKSVFNPQHPLADATGHVTMPNVSVVEEMVNMIAASRSYQNNVEVLNTAKSMLLKTLTLGQ